MPSVHPCTLLLLNPTAASSAAAPCCCCCTTQLVPLESSKLKGLVNTRVGVMQEIGWDPEWEVNPKELKLVERIGEQQPVGQPASQLGS